MHLIKMLREHYKVEEDWEGQRYLGLGLILAGAVFYGTVTFQKN